MCTKFRSNNFLIFVRLLSSTYFCFRIKPKRSKLSSLITSRTSRLYIANNSSKSYENKFGICSDWFKIQKLYNNYSNKIKAETLKNMSGVVDNKFLQVNKWGNPTDPGVLSIERKKVVFSKL